MKTIGKFLIVLIGLLMVLCVSVGAMETGFYTVPLDEDSENRCLTKPINLITKEPDKQAIECFDVREDGMIAIGRSWFSDKIVCVYHGTEFQYGYRFDTQGSYAVEWDNENLLIYLVRSDIALAVNPQGEVVEAREISDQGGEHSIHNNRYWNELDSRKRIVGDTEYRIQSDMGLLNFISPTYSQVVITTSDGTETIVYDVNERHFWNVLVGLIAVCVLVGVGLWSVGRMLYKVIKDACAPFEKAKAVTGEEAITNDV